MNLKAPAISRIVITGPESTGKTSIATALASHYGVPYAPEYARAYLQERGGAYVEKDLLAIAQGQRALERTLLEEKKQWILCDTAMVVMKVWSEVAYGRCHPWIEAQLEDPSYNFYFLCGTDIPWEYDPLREHPTDRDFLFKQYKEVLNNYQLPYRELWGSEATRLSQAIQKIDHLLGK